MGKEVGAGWCYRWLYKGPGRLLLLVVKFTFPGACHWKQLFAAWLGAQLQLTSWLCISTLT